MGWKGGLLGGALGYVIGLFFKSSILIMITLKLPTLDQYLTSTFIPSSIIDFIRFFTVPVPFALLGAALGALYLNQAREKVGKVPGPGP